MLRNAQSTGQTAVNVLDIVIFYQELNTKGRGPSVKLAMFKKHNQYASVDETKRIIQEMPPAERATCSVKLKSSFAYSDAVPYSVLRGRAFTQRNEKTEEVYA